MASIASLSSAASWAASCKFSSMDSAALTRSSLKSPAEGASSRVVVDLTFLAPCTASLSQTSNQASKTSPSRQSNSRRSHMW